jgi:hypothetical protein
MNIASNVVMDHEKRHGTYWGRQAWQHEPLQQYAARGILNNAHVQKIQECFAEQRIDPIPSEIVAKVDIMKLQQAAPNAWIRDTLKYLHPKYSVARLPIRCSEEERQKKRAKKGVPKEKRLRTVMQSVVHKLMKDSNLYKRWSPGTEVKFKAVPSAHAAAFLVEKPGKYVKISMLQRSSGEVIKRKKFTVLRMITDARAGNAECGDSSSFNMFTLDALLQCVSNVSHQADHGTKKWYAISADLRHWFHQLPLPEHLQQLFKLILDKITVVPCAVPMGWYLAPVIAQAATWTLVLGEADGIRLPKGTPRHDTTMPAWLPFSKNGKSAGHGGVFVLIDNIFIVTPDEDVAKKWKTKLTEMARHLHVIFKDPGVRVIELDATKIDASSVEFMGIRFHYDGWSTVEKQHDVVVTTQMTHRQLSSLLGLVLWDMRVRNLKPLDHRELLRLYSKVTPENPDKWDELLSLEQHEEDLLSGYVADAQQHINCERMSRWAPGKVARYAVDACRSESLSQIAIVPMNESKLEQPSEIRWRKNPHEYQYIGEAELLAIVWAVEDAVESDPFITAVLIATDSNCARGWVERMYADRPGARSLLRRLRVALDGRRIALTYVASDDNVADAPSRDTEHAEGDIEIIHQDQWKATTKVLGELHNLFKNEAPLQGGVAIRRLRNNIEVQKEGNVEEEKKGEKTKRMN